MFCDDVEIDTTDDAGPGTEISGVDAYLSMLRPFMDGARSVHHGHMPEIELTGPDTARGVWAMEDHVWFADATGLGKLWGTGWYEEEYRRLDGRWRIARMVLRRQYVEMGGVQTFPPLRSAFGELITSLVGLASTPPTGPRGRRGDARRGDRPASPPPPRPPHRLPTTRAAASHAGSV